MFWWLITIGAVLLIIGLASYRPLRRIYREVEAEKACKQFTHQQEHLEAHFQQLASLSGKPKGLRWENCDFHSPAHYARDRKTGALGAFLEVTIRFSAIEGGGMEDVQAVSNLRHASAVFHYRRGRWGTAGRAIFNMTPPEAIAHLNEQFEPLPLANHPRKAVESE